MVESYNQWYEKIGIILEDDIKKWFESIPTVLEMCDIIDDENGFIVSTLRDAYSVYTEENAYVDYMYDIKQEQELLEGHCF